MKKGQAQSRKAIKQGKYWFPTSCSHGNISLFKSEIHLTPSKFAINFAFRNLNRETFESELLFSGQIAPPNTSPAKSSRLEFLILGDANFITMNFIITWWPWRILLQFCHSNLSFFLIDSNISNHWNWIQLIRLQLETMIFILGLVISSRVMALKC